MDAGIQQFLNSDTNHTFPLVKSPPFERTIPRNTGLFSVLFWPPAPQAQEFKAVKPFPVTGPHTQAAFPEKQSKIAGSAVVATPFYSLFSCLQGCINQMELPNDDGPILCLFRIVLVVVLVLVIGLFTRLFDCDYEDEDDDDSKIACCPCWSLAASVRALISRKWSSPITTSATSANTRCR
jgi:hypothetical protein